MAVARWVGCGAVALLCLLLLARQQRQPPAGGLQLRVAAPSSTSLGPRAVVSKPTSSAPWQTQQPHSSSLQLPEAKNAVHSQSALGRAREVFLHSQKSLYQGSISGLAGLAMAVLATAAALLLRGGPRPSLHGPSPLCHTNQPVWCLATLSPTNSPFAEEWFLIPSEGEGDVFSFLDLQAGCVLVLGNDASAGATYTKPSWVLAGAVADTHCKFEYLDGGYWLEDLGSPQGTHVNDTRLEPFQPYRVCPGDRIMLGENNLDAEFEVVVRK
eukprot:EG_transcript_18135